MNDRKLANILGWFSLGLGLAEVVSPHTFTRAFNTRNRTALVRTAYGLREIAAGVGILKQPNPAPWVWARVGGDILDLTTLGKAWAPDNPKRRNVEAALASVIAITVLDVVCALQLEDRGARGRRGW